MDKAEKTKWILELIKARTQAGMHDTAEAHVAWATEVVEKACNEVHDPEVEPGRDLESERLPRNERETTLLSIAGKGLHRLHDDEEWQVFCDLLHDIYKEVNSISADFNIVRLEWKKVRDLVEKSEDKERYRDTVKPFWEWVKEKKAENDALLT